jgi:hypothetical protein
MSKRSSRPSVRRSRPARRSSARRRFGDRVAETLKDYFRFPYREHMLDVTRQGNASLWRADITDGRGLYMWYAFGETMELARDRAKKIIDDSYRFGRA